LFQHSVFLVTTESSKQEKTKYQHTPSPPTPKTPPQKTKKNQKKKKKFFFGFFPSHIKKFPTTQKPQPKRGYIEFYNFFFRVQNFPEAWVAHPFKKFRRFWGVTKKNPRPPPAK